MAGPDASVHQERPGQPISQIASDIEVYLVNANDNLYTIASRYLNDPDDWRELQRINGISDLFHLQPRTRLRIPKTLLKHRPLSAKVISVIGSIEFAMPNRAFVPVQEGTSLSEGDRVRVGQDSYLSLLLPNGSHVTLPSNSTILIRKLDATVLTSAIDQQFELERGEIDTDVVPLKSPRDVFRITTPSAVAGVRGTAFRVVWNPDQRSTAVEVTRGRVDVRHAAPALKGVVQTVNAGYGNLTSVGQAAGTPIKLLDAPQLSHPGKVQTAASVSFEVVPVEGATAYRAQITRDAAGLDIIRDRTSNSAHIDMGELPDGNYFVRLAAIDLHHLQGMQSVYAVIRRVNSISLSSSALEKNRYEFRWLSGQSDDSQRYRFILGLGPDFNAPLLDIMDLGDNGLVISGLPTGRYYWKVVSEKFDNKEYHSITSPVESFTIGY